MASARHELKSELKAEKIRLKDLYSRYEAPRDVERKVERLTAELRRRAEEAESTLEGLRMTHGRVQAQLRAERGERGVSITGYPTAVLEGAVTCSGSGLEHGLVRIAACAAIPAR